MDINTDLPGQSMAKTVLALDFGGTKLAAAVVNLESEKIVSPIIRKSTPVTEGASGTLKAMIACGKQALAAYGQAESVKAVGISFGGPVSKDRKNVLLSHHVANWNGAPLVDEISHTFQLPAVMDNDGNVAALGEWWFGGHRQLDNLVYLQVSTGVGGGFIFNRQLYRGAGMAGEPGHHIIDANGPLCSCGRQGCLESVCSGWSIARDGREALLHKPAACPTLVQLSKNEPGNVSAEMVFSAARASDPECRQIISQALNSLAIAVVNLITFLDPEVVVIGGGLTRSKDLFDQFFIPVVNQQLRPLFKDRCQVQFSTLDGKELLLGAAILTREKA